MQIQVKSAEVQVTSGTSKRSGQQYSIREQEAWLMCGGEVRRLKLALGREQAPYAIGLYTLDESTFGVDNFGRLAIARVVLRAVVGKAGYVGPAGEAKAG